jgi:hypothetical protein
MELELPNTLPIFLIGVLGVMLPIMAVMGVFFNISIGISKLKKTTQRAIYILMSVIFVGAITVGFVGTDAANREVNERFSNQLAEKYDATSSRSYTDMRDRLQSAGEASTTLTRDGVTTDVFIKVAHDDKRDSVKLLFTVFNEGSLYPEAK